MVKSCTGKNQQKISKNLYKFLLNCVIMREMVELYGEKLVMFLPVRQTKTKTTQRLNQRRRVK